MKRILILLALAITFASCSNLENKPSNSIIELTGTLQPLGFTTFQYGTHTIVVGQKTYALKSSVVDLKTYEGKPVILKGTKVAGYPVENGPELLEVTKIDLTTAK